MPCACSVAARLRRSPWGSAFGLIVFLAALATRVVPSHAADTPVPRGNEVVVLYNAALPESKAVADYYAERRHVPENRLVGLDLTTNEVITRADFEYKLTKPLIHALVQRELLMIRDELRPAVDGQPGQVLQVVAAAKVRSLAVCYGVPLRIAEDNSRKEPQGEILAEGLRRNEAAVDAELTALPLLLAGQPIVGPLANPWFGFTNGSQLNPAKGVFLVGRLDGPTPEIAKALVDRALDAEQNGLLGRGYFDLRGVTEPPYVAGDLMISNAWSATTRYGFDTVLDTKPSTFAPGFPLGHVALYAGWYETSANGPFALPQVEFMPGAIAYHLHSFSAATLRSTNLHWAGPLLSRGVTATMGMVAEPYLDGTPDIGLAFVRLLYSGFTWGEAAVVSQKMLSWQLAVIGDPLYRPFSLNALDRAKDLLSRGSGRGDWALGILYNRKRMVSQDVKKVLPDLKTEQRLAFSPILQEKLGDFLRDAGDAAGALKEYRRALTGLVSPQQRKRLLWNAAEMSQATNQKKDAYEFYAEIAHGTATPVPEPSVLFERLHSLATALDDKAGIEQWSAELSRARAGKP